MNLWSSILSLRILSSKRLSDVEIDRYKRGILRIDVKIQNNVTVMEIAFQNSFDISFSDFRFWV